MEVMDEKILDSYAEWLADVVETLESFETGNSEFREGSISAYKNALDAFTRQLDILKITGE